MKADYNARLKALKESAKTLKNRRAKIKFDGGQGALLCNGCKVILKPGFDHEDKLHFCEDCKRGM